MTPAQVDAPADVDMDPQYDDEETMANKIINEEYKIWKKNSPFLYDMMMSYALEWPTLTTQWFPDCKEPEDRNVWVHRLLLGTHTSDEKPNYVQIAEVEIPKPPKPSAEYYDDERGEVGGYGKGDAAKIKFNITQKIDHPGEVNKARYQPQNPDILATMCVDGKILVFDRTKHSSTPTGKVDPQIELQGHTKEGFALSWNPHSAGKLASGGEDTTVCLWDLQNVQSTTNILKPARRYTHHKHIVNDVQYHTFHNSWIGSVSDDLTMQIMDVRHPGDKSSLTAKDGHTDAINCLGFSPTTEYLFATASGDKTIGIWDIRNVKNKIHTLEGHNDAVTSLSWHPTEAGVILSGSYDRRVIIWDITKAGEEQLPEDQEDGPPELLFMHGGHTNHLADLSWNPNCPWMICSAAEDNLLQIYTVADSIVNTAHPDIPIDELNA